MVLLRPESAITFAKQYRDIVVASILSREIHLAVAVEVRVCYGGRSRSHWVVLDLREVRSRCPSRFRPHHSQEASRQDCSRKQRQQSLRTVNVYRCPSHSLSFRCEMRPLPAQEETS